MPSLHSSIGSRCSFRRKKKSNRRVSVRENDVYAAYNEDDCDQVTPVLDYLRTKGLIVYDPHIDGWTGQPLIYNWIERGIYNAKRTVVFLTKQFLSSNECHYQATTGVHRYAHTKGDNQHQVLVVMLESCKLPRPLRRFHCVYSWKHQQPADQQYAKIYEAVLNQGKKPGISWKNPVSKLSAKISDVKQKQASRPMGNVAQYRDILFSIRQLKMVLEQCELHCTSYGCTFRCRGSAWQEFCDHVKICRYQLVMCRYCRHCVSRRNIKRHEEERCQLKRVPCTNEGCTKMLSSRDFDAHKKDCPFQETECQRNHLGCEVVFAKKDRHKHLEVCEYEYIYCRTCKSLYFRKDIQIHKCPGASPVYMRCASHTGSSAGSKVIYQRPLDTYRCRNSGCGFRDTFGELEGHKKRCEFKKTQCSECGVWVIRRDLYTHTTECNRLLECENCYMMVPSSTKQTHDRYSCISTKILPLCKFCHMVLDRKSVVDHELDCQVKFKLPPCVSEVNILNSQSGTTNDLQQSEYIPSNARIVTLSPLPLPITVSPIGLHGLEVKATPKYITEPTHLPKRIPIPNTLKRVPESRHKFNLLMRMDCEFSALMGTPEHGGYWTLSEFSNRI